MLFEIFGLIYSRGAAGVQFALLFLVLLWVLFDCLSSRKPLPLVFLIAVSMIVAAFLPNPSYLQYFAFAFPFMVMNLAGPLKQLWPVRHDGQRRWFLGAVVIFYCLLSSADLLNYTVNEEIYPGDHNRKIQEVAEVSKEIDRLTNGHGDVFSFWPGYLLQTSNHAMPGMENQFGITVSMKVTPDEAKNYHLLTKEDLVRLIKQGNPAAVLVDDWFVKRELALTILTGSQYALAERKDEIDFYLPVRPGKHR